MVNGWERIHRMPRGSSEMVSPVACGLVAHAVGPSRNAMVMMHAAVNLYRRLFILAWPLFALMVHGLLLDPLGKRGGLKLAMGLNEVMP